MANNCYFEMQITGRREAVEEFIRMISYKGEFENDGLGRVFSFDPILGGFQPSKNGQEFVNYCAEGDCAWSLRSALLNSHPRNLYGETRRLGIAVEAYSSEPGNRFQEHILMCCGSLVVNERADYVEYWVGSGSEANLAAWSEELGITIEELKAGVNENGDYTVGGFGDDFGNFEDAAPILQDMLEELSQNEPHATLDAKIADANVRREDASVDGQEPEHIR